MNNNPTKKRYWLKHDVNNKKPELTDWGKLAIPEVREFAIRLSDAVHSAIHEEEFGKVEGLREALRHLAQSFDAA